MKWDRRKTWNVLILLAVVAWIPINLWMRRHDDALLRAVIEDDLAVAQQAVNEGANVHMTIKRNFTLLQVAAMNHDDIAIVQFLMNQGVSPAATNEDGDTAFGLAKQNGHDQVAAYLMESLKSTTNQGLQRTFRTLR